MKPTKMTQNSINIESNPEDAQKAFKTFKNNLIADLTDMGDDPENSAFAVLLNTEDQMKMTGFCSTKVLAYIVWRILSENSDIKQFIMERLAEEMMQELEAAGGGLPSEPKDIFN